MTIDEAVIILKQHNEWRRDKNYPSVLVMPDPTELGIAIDVIVNYFEKKEMVVWVNETEWNMF